MKQLFKIMWILFILISCGNDNNKKISETETKNKIEKEKNLRYGSGKVGYVTKTEKWLEFVDPDASINAVQIAIDPVNIITLDIVGVNGNSTVDRAVSRTKERYLNFGISSEDIVEKDVKINGYKGKQVTVKIPDGRIFIVNYIENNGNITGKGPNETAHAIYLHSSENFYFKNKGKITSLAYRDNPDNWKRDQ